MGEHGPVREEIISPKSQNKLASSKAGIRNPICRFLGQYASTM